MILSGSLLYWFITIKLGKTQLYNRNKVKNEKVTNLRELMSDIYK